MTLKSSQAGAAFNIPKSNRVVRAARHHQPVMVLKAGDAPLVTIQGAHKLAGARRPYLDGPVPTGGDDILVIEVNDIHSRSMPDQNSPQVDFRRTHHVPNRDASIFAAGHHHSVAELGIFKVEAEVKDCFAVVDEGVHHLATLDIPNPYCTVRRTRNDHLLVILQAEDRASVACKDSLVLLQSLSIPHLDGVVPQARDNLGVVILKAVNSFAVLASAVDSLQVVFSTPPVVLNSVNVLDDGWIEPPIE